jgi:signal transduction histidine kinase
VRGGPALVTVDTAGPVPVLGDRAQLERVVRNLVDNADRHANTASTVSVRATADHAVLTVADDGPGIPSADRQRVFERFVRLDEARNRDDGGVTAKWFRAGCGNYRELSVSEDGRWVIGC